MSIKIKNYFSKDVEIDFDLNITFSLDGIKSSLLNDDILKTFNLTINNKVKENFSTFIKVYKRINAKNINLHESIPDHLTKKYLHSVKSTINDIIDNLNNNKYKETYNKQEELFSLINSYNCDLNTINAFLNLEKNDSIKKNLLSFKSNKSFIYSRDNTTTGRLTINNFPNILTLPKKYRSIFKTSFDKGNIFYIDFVSLEPRVMRKLGGYDCQNDIYDEINNYLDIDLDRSIIKQAVISTAYGSSKKSLYNKISKEKVDKLFLFLEEFLCTKKCVEIAENSYEDNCRLNFWNRPIWNKQVKEKNIILNNYVQSTAVDVALLGFSEIIQKLNKDKVKTLFIIHDALMIDVKEDYTEEFVNITKKGYNCKELGYFPISIEDLNGTKY